jgi:hypothetical protein
MIRMSDDASLLIRTIVKREVSIMLVASCTGPRTLVVCIKPLQASSRASRAACAIVFVVEEV